MGGNEAQCKYCDKKTSSQLIGKHMMKHHKSELLRDFGRYEKQGSIMPLNSTARGFCLCFTCGAYSLLNSNCEVTKAAEKHLDKHSINEQLKSLREYFGKTDAVTLAKQERSNDIEATAQEETIELNTNEIENADIDDVKPVIVKKKKEPVTLYHELTPVNHHCTKCDDYEQTFADMEQDAADMEQKYSEKCAQIVDLETQLSYQLGYEIAINTYKQKVERLEHAIQIRDKRIKELSKSN